MSDEIEPLDSYVAWIASEAQRPVIMDPAVRRRLLDALRNEPVPRRHRRGFSRVLEPRRFAVPPLAAAALAAGLVGIGILAGITLRRDGRRSTEQPHAVAAGTPRLPESLAPHAIKFVLIAPQAARVSLVGDFNGWDVGATPMVTAGKKGEWTVFVPLQPGLHTYSFVVDGSHFLPDPAAPLAPDDGYGNRNSIVLVGGSTS